MSFNIKRQEANEIERSRGWALVYGRRKVGKTYLLKNFTKWDNYYLVRKDGSLTLDSKGQIRQVMPIELTMTVGEQLNSGQTTIIDEFQRLPSTFLDDIAAYHPKGKLILTGSSFRITKDVFGSNSPVLGLFAEHRIGLVEPSDILSSLSEHMSAEKTVEFSAFARDPWIVPHLSFQDSSEELFRIAKLFPNAITGLVGEVFQEEERSYTQLYEAILRLFGAGYSKSEEIASILSSRGVIKERTTSAVIPMINNMESMDLVSELPIFRSKRKKAYLLRSPIFELFFRLADRYDIENRDVGFKEVEGMVRTVRNIAIQRFVGEIFAKAYRGNLEYSFDPEIDFIITKKGSPVIVGEVKWGKYDKKDLGRFIDRTSDLGCPRVLITKKDGIRSDEADIIGPKGLIDIASNEI
ncbi:MAG: AAA family ATPase [Candidatus Thermoplasmatota archaeon]|nr:AAA family ATPase [Candidatus Thermoplasmatota archaeon]